VLQPKSQNRHAAAFNQAAAWRRASILRGFSAHSAKYSNWLNAPQLSTKHSFLRKLFGESVLAFRRPWGRTIK
jgi:hypothetical protein